MHTDHKIQILDLQRSLNFSIKLKSITLCLR